MFILYTAEFSKPCLELSTESFAVTTSIHTYVKRFHIMVEKEFSQCNYLTFLEADHCSDNKLRITNVVESLFRRCYIAYV